MELEVNFNKAMAQAAELRRIADNMLSMNERALTNAMGEVQRGWQGETARQFIKKCSDLKALIEGEAVNIRRIADNLEIGARETGGSGHPSAESGINTASGTARNVISNY